VALAAFVAPPAHADEYNKLTYLTFSGPVQIPGATLAPGTYMFKLADSMSDRHIVQVFDKAGTKLYATLLAIPDQRLDTPEKNVVLFGERPAGTPQAVKAWWYPGNSIGDEFVYPKSQAMKLARANHEPVLSMPDEGASDRAKMSSAKVGRVTESGEVAENEPAQPATTTPAAAQNKPATTTAPAATTTAPPATTTATSRNTNANKTRSTTAKTNTAPAPTGTSGTTAPRSLPQTASNLPLVELLSGLAFAGAFGVRQLRVRFASRV
jgi:hypothetical protein